MANAKYGMPYKSAICRLAELRLGLNKFLIGWGKRSKSPTSGQKSTKSNSGTGGNSEIMP